METRLRWLATVIIMVVGYGIRELGNMDAYYVDLSGYDGYNDSLYFPHHTNENLTLFNENSSEDRGEIAECGGYWLSSPFGDDDTNIGGVRCGGQVSWFWCTDDDLFPGLRPVVVLNCEVNLEWMSIPTEGKDDEGYFEMKY